MVLPPVQRVSMRQQTQPYRSRSLSPRAPYLWHEREEDTSERKSRKGWYRVDYGPSKTEQVWYLPSFKDRMNFLERSVERATSEPRVRASSVPPPTVTVRRTRALSVDPIVSYPYRWRTWPFYYHNYRRPYSSYYDMYWPSLGPYSGRIWRLPWYRYPSSPLTVSTSWRDSSPYSSYSATTTITPESTEVTEERRSMSPSPSSSYRPSASTQLILNRVALGRASLPPRSYPPARYIPRYYPSYYDYDYGYGGYYYPNYYPRHSRYDYLDDLDSPYLASTYRPRALDLDTDYRDKKTTTTPTKVITTYRTYTPGMLQDHVDNMRIRLKSLAYSLDPTGPVPEIVIPERTSKKSSAAAAAIASAPGDKKYSSAVEFSELPKLASRRQRYYPEDEHIKDNLRIQCLSHYKTTRTAADYWKPKQYIPTEPLSVMPESSYRPAKYSSSKWEEPDTVFGGPSDKKPYSKAITDGTTEEAEDEKKERRKKKKSKERDVPEATTEAASASTTAAPAAAVADHPTSEADPVSAPTESEAGAVDAEERKKLEKKKRKAEREAAAKAAMDAELAALAAAEAELARLEAEDSKKEAPAKAAPAEVKSESAAEKCESSTEVVCEGVCVKPESPGELAPSQTPPQVPPQEEPEAPQVHEEPRAPPEAEQAVEPKTEEPQPEPPVEEPIPEDLPPLKESQVELPPVEKPQVESPAEEPPVEPPVESPVEPSAEEAPVESPVELPVEEAPVEPSVEVQQMEEPQAKPAVEEPQIEEPKPEPPVEAQVEATSVEKHVEKAEEPSAAPRRRATLEEDSGWLDAWDGEAAAPEAGAQEAGQQLGTDASEEPATTTQAEEARLGAQEEDTEAAAHATATTTDAADATIPDTEAAAAAAAETGTDDAADTAPPARFDEELTE